jgi:aryl-alcohol dehydrogenase-like predicted oxidoreductase
VARSKAPMAVTWAASSRSADGRAEEIIGRWLAARPGRRELAVLATKGRFPTDESPNGHGLSRRHLSLALEASLRRLNVETIDLSTCTRCTHGPADRLEETLRFLDDAVRAGKINYVGLSNFTGWQLQKAVDIAGFRGLSAPVSMQPQYNLLARAVEWEIVPACRPVRVPRGRKGGAGPGRARSLDAWRP